MFVNAQCWHQSWEQKPAGSSSSSVWTRPEILWEDAPLSHNSEQPDSGCSHRARCHLRRRSESEQINNVQLRLNINDVFTVSSTSHHMFPHRLKLFYTESSPSVFQKQKCHSLTCVVQSFLPADLWPQSTEFQTSPKSETSRSPDLNQVGPCWKVQFGPVESGVVSAGRCRLWTRRWRMQQQTRSSHRC